MSIQVPENLPEGRFYYHYKHNPNGPINNYAYELIAIGCHTEEDCRPEDAFTAVYLPLYESSAIYTAGKTKKLKLLLTDVRPLKMFTENVTKGGATFPRFQEITDPEVIKELQLIRDKMYP